MPERSRPAAPEAAGTERRPAASPLPDAHMEVTQEFAGDGATGANRAYGNMGGNQGAVMRKTKR